MQLLLPRRNFASRQWFDAACQIAHVRPHVLLESGAPDSLVALARAGYAIAIVRSNAKIPRGASAASASSAGAGRLSRPGNRAAGISP